MASFVTIQDWMLELGLKCTEINALAVIWSFGKDGEWFQGSASYLGKWMGVSKKETVRKALGKLVSKGLVEKRERWEKGQHLCDYRPVRTPHQGGAKTSPRPGAESSLHNNRPDSDSDIKEINNKEIHLSVEDFHKQHRT